MSKKSIHVISTPKGGWSVRSEGASRASKTFVTQEVAVKHARQAGKERGVEVVVHGRDGRIRDVSSYGNDARTAAKKK